MTKRYTIAASLDFYPDKGEVEELERKVNRLIDDGYKPIGGVGVRTGGERGAYFVQAMLLPEDDETQRSDTA